MKDLMMILLIFALVCAIVLPPSLIFATEDYKVVLINPTEEQVLDLYKSTSERSKFWVREAHAVKGEQSLVEATIGVRQSGGEEKLQRELDKLGLEYYILGKALRR